MLASESGGLGAVHLLPLDPGIQNLHHEGRLLLGPSHILVQHARQEKELQSSEPLFDKAPVHNGALRGPVQL